MEFCPLPGIKAHHPFPQVKGIHPKALFFFRFWEIKSQAQILDCMTSQGSNPASAGQWVQIPLSLVWALLFLWALNVEYADFAFCFCGTYVKVTLRGVRHSMVQIQTCVCDEDTGRTYWCQVITGKRRYHHHHCKEDMNHSIVIPNSMFILIPGNLQNTRKGVLQWFAVPRSRKVKNRMCNDIWWQPNGTSVFVTGNGVFQRKRK